MTGKWITQLSTLYDDDLGVFLECGRGPWRDGGSRVDLLWVSTGSLCLLGGELMKREQEWCQRGQLGCCYCNNLGKRWCQPGPGQCQQR